MITIIDKIENTDVMSYLCIDFTDMLKYKLKTVWLAYILSCKNRNVENFYHYYIGLSMYVKTQSH